MIILTVVLNQAPDLGIVHLARLYQAQPGAGWQVFQPLINVSILARCQAGQIANTDRSAAAPRVLGMQRLARVNPVQLPLVCEQLMDVVLTPVGGKPEQCWFLFHDPFPRITEKQVSGQFLKLAEYQNLTATENRAEWLACKYSRRCLE